MQANNIEPAEVKIAAFEPFRAQLSELRLYNQNVVFNYTDPKGNKDARSHIYKLRRTKSTVDQARKDAGKDAMDYKRRVDAEGKEIIAEIEGMIAVHQGPLDEIEQREKERIERHQRGLDRYREYASGDFSKCSTDQLQAMLTSIQEDKPGDEYEEFSDKAVAAQATACEHLKEQLEAARKREAERAELERLQAAEAERQRQEREAQIAREAEERAKREAQAEAERKEREHRAAIERAEREKVEAEAATKQAQIDAERRQAEALEAERQRIANEQATAEAAAANRAANKRHQASVNREALADLLAIGHTEAQAKALIEAVVRGQVRHMQINY